MGSAYKKLSQNILLFAVSSFGTKIIGFLLVPLYTSCLTTEEYGIADMLSTIVQLAVPVLSLDIADGVIRFLLEKKNNSTSILLSALRVIFFGSFVFVILLFGLRLTNLVIIPDKYYLFIFFSYLFTSIYNTFVSFCKGIEKIKTIVIAGILSSLINAVFNIVFLVYMGMGVDGYLTSHLCAVAIPLLYLVICVRKFGYLDFKTFRTDKELEKKMILFSVPLIVNCISWWINNSLDRFFVMFICGASANGLLAVAYKIPSIISMLQTIFNQAWSISAVQEFDPKDKNGFIGKIYSYYGAAITISGSAILLINIPLARLLYANDFFVAWKYAGILIIANLFGGLSVCISGVFNAVKKTKILASTTLMGAAVNTVFNALFIPVIGLYGAVTATMISNIAVWIYRMVKVRTYIRIKMNIVRDIVSYILLILQCLVGLTQDHMYVVQVVLFVGLLILYHVEMVEIIKKILKQLKRLRNGSR